MFLQFIQSHLTELPDISKTPDVDVKRLSVSVVDPKIDDINFLWGIIKTAKVQMESTIGKKPASGLVNGSVAIDSIETMAPKLKRFVSFYEEEDFYI